METIWTMTIDADNPCEAATTVHATRDDAIKCLFANYNQAGIYGDEATETAAGLLIDGECLTVNFDQHPLPGRDVAGKRADGRQRMTLAQRDRLWELCAGYNMAFREDDYVLHAPDATFLPGYVEGYVGADPKTIWVGVAPDGSSSS